MEIIDAHHHIWERGRFSYGWLESVPAIGRDFLLGDYEEVARPCGVVKSVCVQADVDEVFSLQETRWMLSLAEAEGPIEGVVSWAPVDRSDLEDFLDTLGDHPQLKGVRRLIQGEADARFCARPEFVAGVRALARRGLSFDLCIYHHQLPAAIELVRQVPEAAFVLDHMGKPAIAAGEMEPWKAQLRELAGMDHVLCKVSGMVTEAHWRQWKLEDLRPYLDHVIEVFGFERLMFGSDWPVCTLAAEYRRWFDGVQEAVREASAGERQQLGMPVSWTQSALGRFRIRHRRSPSSCAGRASGARPLLAGSVP